MTIYLKTTLQIEDAKDDYSFEKDFTNKRPLGWPFFRKRLYQQKKLMIFNWKQH